MDSDKTRKSIKSSIEALQPAPAAKHFSLSICQTWQQLFFFFSKYGQAATVRTAVHLFLLWCNTTKQQLFGTHWTYRRAAEKPIAVCRTRSLVGFNGHFDIISPQTITRMNTLFCCFYCVRKHLNDVLPERFQVRNVMNQQTGALKSELIFICIIYNPDNKSSVLL